MRWFALLALTTGGASASGLSLLDDVNQRDDVLTLTFSCPVALLNAFPGDGGMQLNLRLAPGPDCVPALADQAGAQRWPTAAESADALSSLELQVDGVGATSVVLRFTAPRAAVARQGRGSDRIEVVLNTPPPASAGPRLAAATEPVRSANAAAADSSNASRVATLMEDARRAFVAGELDRAVALYTAVCALPEHAESANALEFLGVTRQRKGQLAHAKAIYTRYLDTYPDREGRVRVEQRLAMITAPPSLPGRSAATRSAVPGQWQTYGAHSSYVRRNSVSIDSVDAVNNLALWQGDLDLVARRRGASLDTMARLTAGYRSDFADVGRDRSGMVVTNAWLDLSDRARGLHARLGRQARSSGGVYGRFDGALLSWDWRDGVRLNAVAGFPVRRSSSTFESTRVMAGASVDFEEVLENWDLTLFANNHTVDGIADRRGLGGEFRYFSAGRNVYGLLDYDTLYASVNASMIAASITMANRVNLHGTLDYRRSPLLSTSNAIIGQGVTSIDQLNDTLREDELQQLAADNTATSTSATVGVSLPLGERFQWSTDVQASELQTAVNFASLAGANASNRTLALNTQLVATSWWRSSDAWILGLRVADSESYRLASFTVNTRLPLGDHLRINPLLRIVSRRHKLYASDEWIVSPGLRASLRWQRRFVIEAEVRSDLSRRSSLIGDTDRSSLYFSLGYRADFGR